ncbi:MAG: 30S ribosomal protein S6 [bacterium]
MTRRYEMMVIIDSSQSDEEIEAQIAKLEEAITSSPGGEIINTDKWGKKRLAYEIKGKQFGYYVVIEFMIDPNLISDMNRNLRYDTNILRHLILHISPKVIRLKEQEQELKVHLEDRRRRLADEAEEQPVVDLISDENSVKGDLGDIDSKVTDVNAEEKVGAEVETETETETDAKAEAGSSEEHQ